MQLISTYGTTIRQYNRIFKDTLSVYRAAVDFFIAVALAEWDKFASLPHPNMAIAAMEEMAHKTKAHDSPRYDFDKPFVKFPSYLRRAAIMEAVGRVSSYKSNHARWEASGKQGREPGPPRAGFAFPVMYKDNMYQDAGEYSARIKICKDGKWQWLDIGFRKSDADYIRRHCDGQKRLSPTLVRKGKKWHLAFPFEQDIYLPTVKIQNQTVLAVDLGINNACACTVMTADGAVHGRRFLKLPVETDRLRAAINRVKKAQQHGQHKTPRLWAKADGINDDIACKTAKFIIETAVLYNVDVIVFERLDVRGKKRGSKKQRLHLWKASYVQDMVMHKAHALGIRVNRVCAWNTSRLAFDGTGRVERGRYIQDGEEKYNYSICVFKSGKTYNCDLNAAYNIGARYFLRGILKSVSATERLALEAKVPSAARRSTSTLSTLLSLNAELEPIAA